MSNIKAAFLTSKGSFTINIIQLSIVDKVRQDQSN